MTICEKVVRDESDVKWEILAITNIRRYGMHFRGGSHDRSFSDTRIYMKGPEEASNNNRSRGGRKRKKTRKHKNEEAKKHVVVK